LPQEYWNFITTLLIWAAIAILAYLILFRWLRTFVARTRFDADNIALRTIRAPLIAAIIAYGIVHALQQLELTASTALFFQNAYVVSLIAAIAFLGWRIVKEVVLRWLTARAADTDSRVDDLVVPLVGTIGPLVFFILALVFILQFLGINVGVLAASIGVFGLIIGLAFQEALSNVFSGIYLMVDPSFQENDLINFDGKTYTVERVGLRMTRLYDMATHSLIFMPNKTLTANEITNITRPTIDLKVRMSVSMPSAVEPVRAITLLHNIVASNRNTLGVPEVKLEALRKRIDSLIALEPAVASGERYSTLVGAFTALEGWLAGDAGTDDDHERLVQVRREMNDRLTEAQVATRRLPRGRMAHNDIENLRHALGGRETETDIISERRIESLNAAVARVQASYSPPEVAPLMTAVSRLNELEAIGEELESAIASAEQSRETELDRLMSALVWAGDWLAEDLVAHGRRDEAARISLWVRNMACVYSEVEVRESLDGLDKEISRMIKWLNDVEAGGLNNQERARIQGLFGRWGGLKQMEARRIDEMRRRIHRWIAWKEQDTLSPDEYKLVLLHWERKLRILSRRIPDTGLSDEDALDTELVATRDWMHTIQFMETLPEWKMPSVTVNSVSDSTIDYTLIYNVDDIKRQHFERESYVNSGILLDLHETCKRENIAAVTARKSS
jgi:small-conductance mechanosensitive channel